jgi:hypothetical protein
MKIAEILMLLPQSDVELEEATIAEMAELPARRKLFAAAHELDLLIRQGRVELIDVCDLLPRDLPTLEQVLISGEGQKTVRTNIVRAREILVVMTEQKRNQS